MLYANNKTNTPGNITFDNFLKMGTIKKLDLDQKTNREAESLEKNPFFGIENDNFGGAKFLFNGDKISRITLGEGVSNFLVSNPKFKVVDNVSKGDFNMGKLKDLGSDKKEVIAVVSSDSVIFYEKNDGVEGCIDDTKNNIVTIAG